MEKSNICASQIRTGIRKSIYHFNKIKEKKSVAWARSKERKIAGETKRKNCETLQLKFLYKSQWNEQDTVRTVPEFESYNECLPTLQNYFGLWIW